MGTLNIVGSLNIHNYLAATNTNLYLSSASTDYSIRLRAGTTEFLRAQLSSSVTGAATGTITGLYLFGPTYGNDATYTKIANQLSIGDPGPQIIFNTQASISSGQPCALIYTDHNNIFSGNSLSLVSSESNCAFIAPTIKALTKFIGTLDGNAATATKLTTARTLTIGSTGKTFNGSANVSWTLAEIGAAAASHTNHPTLTITSTSASAHLAFSRANLNYITCPASGYLGFSVNGQGTSLAVCDLVINNGQVYPGASNATTLGTTSYRWSAVYSQRLIAYSTTDAAAASANNVALITGDPSGQHIEFDGNEIISKSNGTTGGVLYINSGGAYTQLYTIGGTSGQTYGSTFPTAYTTGQIFFKI